MSQIKAPWTEDQVASLNGFQKSKGWHPFTCGSGNRTDSNHLDGEGILLATKEGWACPYCEYKQFWAHTFMVDWSWRKGEDAYQEFVKKFGGGDASTSSKDE